MAYVPDFNEEDLQRALAAQGPPSGLSVDPGPATGGTATPSGPSTPGSSSPEAGAGSGAGTGFVNLSRYFDANAAGADKLAHGVLDPLKVDLTAAGDAAAAAVPKPTAPTNVIDDPSNPAGIDPWTGNATGQPTIGDINAGNQSDYEKALAAANQQAQDARNAAIKNTASTNLTKGQEIVNDPLKLSEAMNTKGQNPSAFDTYLAGAAIQPVYQGLRDYYGATGAMTPAPFDPNAPRDHPPGENLPGTSPRGGALGVPVTPDPGVPTTSDPMASVATAAGAMDPQLRKRSKNLGGW